MSTSIPVSQPSRRMAYAAFAAMLSVYFFSYFQRAAIPGTIFNELQADLGLSAGAVASLGSMFTWIYGGMQIVVGLLVARYGGVRMLLGGGLVMVAGACLFPMAHAVGPLFAARALTGLGASFMYLSIIRELDRLFDGRHFTLLVGVVLCVAYSGGMAATLPFERAAAAFGWRPSLLTVAAVMLVSLAVAGVILRQLGREPGGSRKFSLQPLGEVLRNRSCRALLASSLIAFPVYFVIQTVLGKKFLQDVGGLSSPTSALFILVMTLGSAIIAMAGGYLPRLLGERRKPCLVGGALVLVAAVGVLLAGVLVRAPGWVYLLGFFFLASGAFAIPAGTATMKDLSQPHTVGPGIAVMNSLAYIGAGTIGQTGGLILNHYAGCAQASGAGLIYPRAAYVSFFGFLLALAVLNVIFTCLVPETGGRHGPVAAPAEILADEGSIS
ncbi:MAG: MFS transporter [bacterium]